MLWKARLCLAVVGLLLYCQSPAVSQPSCMPAEAGLAWVSEKYQETPLFEGQMAQERRVVLTWNAETGSWSLLVGDPMGAGLLCMAASGEGGKPYSAPAAPPAPEQKS